MAGFFERVKGLFTAKSVQQIEPTNYQFGSPLDALIEHAIFGGVRITPSKAFEFYRQSSIVATAIEIISKKAESIEPVMRRADGELDNSDPILEFLQKPNDRQIWGEFASSTFRDYLLTGNIYWLASGTITQPPQELYRGHPINISPFTTIEDGFADDYNVSGLLGRGRYEAEPIPGRGNGVRFVRDDDLWQLYHVRDYTTRANQLTGDSPLESIVSEIRQHMSGNTHNSSLLSQGARLSMLFAIKGQIPDADFQELEQKIIDKFGKAGSAGRVGVVREDEIEVQEFGVNNKDMDYVNLIEMVRSSIIARYCIPLPIVVSSRQTFSNFDKATLALYDDAVIPLVNFVFRSLSDFLLPRFGRDPRQERLTYDPTSITALRERIIAEVQQIYALNSSTTNEIRAMLPGYDEVEGGDVVLAPSTLVPIAGSGIDPALMTLEDREAEDEARELANEATRQGMNEGNGNDES